MFRILALLVLCLSCSSEAADPEDSIDAFIDREMPISGVPGLAYAVVADGQIQSIGARGLASLATGEVVTPNTPFLTGSISKSFTALAVMQLVEAHKLELDAGISDYLNVFSSQPAGLITIRQLLSHTSGFSTLQGNRSHTDLPPGKDALARSIAKIATLKPAYAPGSRWEYSNLNYRVLGRLIEQVSGQSYQRYIQSQILEPVGMQDSFVADGQVHQSMATGHRPWFWRKRPLPSSMAPSVVTAPQGGIVASAWDLARYMEVMLNGEDDVLSASGKAAMMRPAGSASPFYGFGWFVDSRNGSVWHSGTSPGFETLLTLIPAERKGAVALVNAGSGTGFGETTQLLHGIISRALALDYNEPASRWLQKVLFTGLVLSPVMFVLAMAWAWRFREKIRAKSGAFGLFSLWFPLLTTLGGAWVIFRLVPRIFGVSIAKITLYQPDLGFALMATAVTGVLWAVFRLVLAYSGKRNAALAQKGRIR